MMAHMTRPALTVVAVLVVLCVYLLHGTPHRAQPLQEGHPAERSQAARELWGYTYDGTPTTYDDDAWPECDAFEKSWIGDSYCDDETGFNTAECGFDGGDCCPSTCTYTNNMFKCGDNGFTCKDPSVEEVDTVCVSALAYGGPLGNGICDEALATEGMPTYNFNTLSCGFDCGWNDEAGEIVCDCEAASPGLPPFSPPGGEAVPPGLPPFSPPFSPPVLPPISPPFQPPYSPPVTPS